MEEMIKRLFEELAKQTERAGFAEKDRDQYEGWYRMYQKNCEALEKGLSELKEKYDELKKQIAGMTGVQKNESISD